ncbi:phenylacetate-CoA oxygenase/reductase subunit PaaK [Brevibacterium sp. 5221]|uniref:Phenylacetate-CoA oxygenase/reductase subunit PaaK n=1 Tax=Brevibacterium rongguiense TaxID=2695267 RepID=A0A6N9H736_9MICO|nr:1,2-phenylacetyl-CoA epoxidase subunit PaaE [Brevibacterium rongguiense]MYM19725.1 phenylacetate-CoA oxygenase/reductase subunit PaaK [Brevibacterium rongguiense]
MSQTAAPAAAQEGGPATQPPPRRRLAFHSLRVEEIRELTADAVEVAFAVPEALAQEFSFVPGQHIAVRTRIDGHEVRRSYSLCAPPDGRQLRIGVKETPDGLFSSFVRRELTVGDELEVMNPQGTFTSEVQSGRIVAIAAGSGITPVMALGAAALREKPGCTFTLVYANRSSADVMFLEELADLKDRYPARFDMHHVLSAEGRSAELYSGRIDAPKLDALLTHLVPPETVDEWFLCGPLPLVELARTRLDAHGVERARIRFELFNTGRPGEDRAPAPRRTRPDEETGPQASIRFTLDGRTGTVRTPRRSPETILAAALRSRPDVPYACAGGVCGTCKAKLCAGTVDMADNFALEPDELAAGYVLTCQSTPTSEVVDVDYDQ